MLMAENPSTGPMPLADDNPGEAEPPTVRFSGVADAQLRSDPREYMAVYGCIWPLAAAVVAVTVAVRDTDSPDKASSSRNQRATL